MKREPKVGDWVRLPNWSDFLQVARVYAEHNVLYLAYQTAGGKWQEAPYYLKRKSCGWEFRDPEPSQIQAIVSDKAFALRLTAEDGTHQHFIGLNRERYDELLTIEEKYKALKAAVKLLVEDK